MIDEDVGIRVAAESGERRVAGSVGPVSVGAVVLGDAMGCARKSTGSDDGGCAEDTAAGAFPGGVPVDGGVVGRRPGSAVSFASGWVDAIG